MNKRHLRTLESIFRRPPNGNIKWRDIEALLTALGGQISEREGSRVEVYLFDQVRIFHRPHPRPTTDKGAVASVREWLRDNGVTP
ncbi:MAG: type II toxin-antitoxin system HicA family toxin [Gammaproteobacteria bacterium]|nr:type II toxin-antitoxin system HicA family toxin [Gammaproteobacteria bacterium]